MLLKKVRTRDEERQNEICRLTAYSEGLKKVLHSLKVNI